MGYQRIRFASKSEWLKARRIGGSTASAVIGLNPYMTNIEAYEVMTGLKEREDISEKPCVIYGREAEGPIRRLFALDHPELEVEEPKTIDKDGYIEMLASSENPFMTATLDGELTEKATGRKGILEIKTSEVLSSMSKERWRGRVPDNYYVQVLHYLLVKDDCSFAILRAQLKYSDGIESWTTQRDYRFEKEDNEDSIKALEEKEKGFWDCVMKKKAPDLALTL
jgi:putative phage-type endonuclease